MPWATGTGHTALGSCCSQLPIAEGGAEMRSSPRRRLGFILTLGLAGATFTVPASLPAYAGSSTLQLSIDHAPGTESLPAGEDYTLTATVRSLCITSCGTIPIELHYDTPWGTIETIAKTPLPHALEQSVEFTIPGNAVRWWNTQTRAPYVFGYYLEAEQLQGVNGLETARSPQAVGSRHERSVVPELDFTLKRADGTPLADAYWELVVHDFDAPSATLASGSADGSGRVIYEIPAAHPLVQAAASSNGGVANIQLFVVKRDATDVVWRLDHMFAVGAGSTWEESSTAGVGIPRGAEFVSVDVCDPELLPGDQINTDNPCEIVEENSCQPISHWGDDHHEDTLSVAAAPHVPWESTATFK